MANIELVKIIDTFSKCGWDLIDAPAKAWLDANNGGSASKAVTTNLIHAIEQADEQCGSCGCEFDPLYKRALELLKNLS